MNPDQIAAYRYIEQAKQARKEGDKRRARQYAEQAARLAPELEDAWLMLAALASPHASVAFMQKALQINPESERVREGMRWAVERLRKEPQRPRPAVRPAPVHAPAPAPARKPAKPRLSFVAILLSAMCLVVFVSAIWASRSFAAGLGLSIENTPSWAAVEIAKPGVTAIPAEVVAPESATEASNATATPTTTATPSATTAPTEIVAPSASATKAVIPFVLATNTNTPANTATETASPAPLPTEAEAPSSTPIVDAPSVEIGAADEPSPTPLPTDTALPGPTQYIPPTVAPGAGNTGGASGARWIDVDLTHQMVYAYQGNTLVNSFLVSTGTWLHPTVTGQYHIYVKYRYKDMSGPGYFLPNVPYTMFFYQGYALHGTYWHSNFGTPMSHGCVNLSIPDSEWLYNFASVGTLVNVHY